MPDIALILNVLSGGASLAAVVVAFLAIQTYRSTRPKLELKRSQDSYVSYMSTLVLELLDYQSTLASNEPGSVDPYLYFGIRSTSRQLHEALGDAMRLRLADTIVGNRSHRWKYFQAFHAGLLEVAELSAQDNRPEKYNKQHYLFGLIRLTSQCFGYEGLHRNDEYIYEELRSKLDLLGPDLVKHAFEYLHVRQSDGQSR